MQRMRGALGLGEIFRRGVIVRGKALPRLVGVSGPFVHLASMETISALICECRVHLREIYPFVGGRASRHFCCWVSNLAAAVRERE